MPPHWCVVYGFFQATMGWVKQYWQTLTGPQNQNYLLFGPLQNKLAALCSETWVLIKKKKKSPGEVVKNVSELGEELSMALE